MQIAAVSYNIPEEAGIYMAVQGLKSGREGGPFGMCAEDLKRWLSEAKREKDPERRR